MNHTYFEIHNYFFYTEPAYGLYGKLIEIYMREIDWYNLSLEIIDNL